MRRESGAFFVGGAFERLAVSNFMMLSPQSSFGTLAIFAVMVCSPALNSALQTQVVDDRDAYAVYSEVVRAVLSGNTLHPRRYSIAQLTSPEKPATNIANYFPESYSTLFSEAFQDYAKRNARPSVLAREFRLPHRYGLLTPDEMEELNQPVEDKNPVAFWQRLDRKFPGTAGLIHLSAVGFNPKKTKAVVRANSYCGLLCAESGYFLLEKRNGRWSITETKITSAS